MKLIGVLKEQVEQTKSKEDARNLIEQAGMELTDDELDAVAGGDRASDYTDGYCHCENPDLDEYMNCRKCGGRRRTNRRTHFD